MEDAPCGSCTTLLQHALRARLDGAYRSPRRPKGTSELYASGHSFGWFCLPRPATARRLSRLASLEIWCASHAPILQSEPGPLYLWFEPALCTRHAAGTLPRRLPLWWRTPRTTLRLGHTRGARHAPRTARTQRAPRSSPRIAPRTALHRAPRATPRHTLRHAPPVCSSHSWARAAWGRCSQKNAGDAVKEAGENHAPGKREDHKNRDDARAAKWAAERAAKRAARRAAANHK